MSLVHTLSTMAIQNLIRKYLKAGVMTTQGYEETKRGTRREDYVELHIIPPYADTFIMLSQSA